MDQLTTIKLHHDGDTGENKSTQGKMEYLPDEILLKIISSLDLKDEQDMKTLKNIELTCHRWRNFANDKQVINQILMRPEITLSKLFPLTIWNPRTLFRLSKLSSQITKCADELWEIWSKAPASPFLPISKKAVLMAGLCGFVALDGIEDNAPYYDLLNCYSPTTIISMLASALIYQEAFLSLFLVTVADHSFRHAQRKVRRILRYILLTKGPFVALRVLQHELANNDLDNDKYDDPSITEQVRSHLRPGQRILVIGSRENDPAIFHLWSLRNAFKSEKKDGSRHWRPDRRIDIRVVNMAMKIIDEWAFDGCASGYFDRDEVLWDIDDRNTEWRLSLLNCLRIWRHGNELL